MRIIVGHIALLEEEKRQATVIRTIDYLCKSGHDAYAVFVGKCKDGDEAYVHELESLTEELGIKERIVFMGYRSDIPDILKGIDVLMIPASFEGFPLAGLEACAAGVPVVACDVGGAKEFVDVSRAGKTFAFNDPADAANSIKCCISFAENYRKKGIGFAQLNINRNYQEGMLEQFAEVSFCAI